MTIALWVIAVCCIINTLFSMVTIDLALKDDKRRKRLNKAFVKAVKGVGERTDEALAKIIEEAENE